MRKTAPAATGRDIEFAWTPGLLVALAALCLAQLLETIDITVVNVALPALRAGLSFSAATLHWVITGYTVCFGGCLLLGGRLGDLLGHRRVFAYGTAVFALASLACALAGGAGEFVAARGVQGVAAGFVSPMTLALLAALFPEGRPRTVAVTVWGAATAVSGALGFVAGGLLVDGPGWRWIFAVNPVICGVVIAAVLRFVPASAPAARGRFDVVGAIVSTCAAGLLVYGVTQIGVRGGNSPDALVPLVLAALLLAYFVLHEARLAAHPLIPVRLFAVRTVAAANLAQFLISGAIYALFYLLSLQLQQTLGRNAVGTGLALVPFSLLLLVCAGSGPLVVRYIGFRGSIAAGGLLGAAGMLLLAHTVTAGDATRAVILPSLVVASGFALTFVPITVAAVTGVPSAQHGIASGLVNVTRTLGGAIGLAVIAAAASDRSDRLRGSGHTIGAALASGFRFGYQLCAVLPALAAVTALLLLRGEGRGRVRTPSPFPETAGPVSN
ncbi:MFS transporter [Nocardia sp. NPDC046763]|uniref:MFS transporter n=1 Tax=Nocardia sp. NPDC046763 TaxID=3155256 RepID=UPI0033E77953